MKLTHVHLRHAPGLPQGLPKVEIGEGLTFIVGPNASGKSTLARTMRLAFWNLPKAPAIGAHIGVQKPSGELVSTEIVGGKALSLLRGTEMESGASELYKLGLADLLRDGSHSDREFAARLETELHGGVPIGQISEEIAAGQTQHRAPRNALRDAKSQVRAALNNNRTLLSEEKEANRLQRERERSEEAQRTVNAIDTLTAAWELDAERRALQAELDLLPKALENLRRDDVEVKRDLERRLQTARNDLDVQKQNLRTLSDAFDRVDDAWKALEPESIEEGQNIRDAKQKAWDKMREHKARALLQDEKLRSAEQSVFGGPVERPLDDKIKYALKNAVEAVRRSEATLHSISDTQQYFDAFDTTEGDEARTQQKVDALREWLSTPQPASVASGGWRAIASALCALLIGVAAIVYVAVYNVAVDAWIGAALVLSVLSAVFSLWLWIQLRQQAAIYAADKARVQNRATQAGVALPAWTNEAVQGTLQQAERELQKCREAMRMRQRQNEVGARVQEARDAYTRAHSALENIAERSGISPHILTVETAEVFNRTEQWLRAEEVFAEAVAARSIAETAYKELDESWTKWLRIHGLTSESKRVGADAVIDVARRKVGEVSGLERDAEHARGAVARETQAVESVEAEKANLKARLGDWFDSEARLERAIEQSGQRQRVSQSLELMEPRYRAALNDLRTSLDRLISNGVLPHGTTLDEEVSPAFLRDLSPEQIRDARKEFVDEAQRLGELIEEVARLRERLQNAKKGSSLEDAFAVRARAEHASLAQAERRGMLMLEEMLLEWSVQQSGHDGASKSLDKANAWLNRFTHGRFGLRLNMQGELVGYDTEAGEIRALSELSDATRVQALLAARLVAIRDAEAGGEKLPIVLDEVFSTTDPERFEAIASALSELVRDGRQIIYLTADPGEYQRWKRLRERARLVEPHVQWLAKLEDDVVHGVAVPDHTPVPAPEGRSASEYAELLDLTPPQMTQRAEEWPILWLLPDALDAVYASMRKRLYSSGQVLSLARTLGDVQVWSDSPERSSEFTSRLTRRVEMLRAMQARWARGVSHSFQWEDVEKSGMVSDVFRDRIVALYREYADDPVTFLESVGDLPRFHSARHEELKQHFESQGILAQEAPATHAELREHALVTVDSASVDAQDVAWLEELLAAHRI